MSNLCLQWNEMIERRWPEKRYNRGVVHYDCMETAGTVVELDEYDLETYLLNAHKQKCRIEDGEAEVKIEAFYTKYVTYQVGINAAVCCCLFSLPVRIPLVSVTAFQQNLCCGGIEVLKNKAELTMTHSGQVCRQEITRLRRNKVSVMLCRNPSKVLWSNLIWTRIPLISHFFSPSPFSIMCTWLNLNIKHNLK